ncbi:MAG TPA: hypothetical protein VE526_07285 [Solirubrobacteraceae bacterium]|jgi:hypothetical protein|nr:hypothetical protein [Solirubrobacteraceae bacterium]
MAGLPLECPGCGTGGAADERFCPRCGSPLVIAGASLPVDADPARARARRIHPPYADGPLVKVARAANQPEAELLQELLLDAGVPSLARRSGGFDVPDFLAMGPRDVLVPAGGAAVAGEVLGAREPRPPVARATLWVRALALVLALLVVAFVAVSVVAAIL